VKDMPGTACFGSPIPSPALSREPSVTTQLLTSRYEPRVRQLCPDFLAARSGRPPPPELPATNTRRDPPLRPRISSRRDSAVLIRRPCGRPPRRGVGRWRKNLIGLGGRLSSFAGVAADRREMRPKSFAGNCTLLGSNHDAANVSRSLADSDPFMRVAGVFGALRRCLVREDDEFEVKTEIKYSCK
jgi:hypothetical protein